jgi:hypothetical protein
MIGRSLAVGVPRHYSSQGVGQERTHREGLTDLLADTVEGFGRLVTQHITLARLEIAEDARTVGASLGRVAVFLPFLFMAYALGCGALVSFLAPWTGWVRAFLAVALANAAVGGIGLAQAALRMRRRKLLGGTLAEFRTSAAALSGDVNTLEGPR